MKNRTIDHDKDTIAEALGFEKGELQKILEKLSNISKDENLGSPSQALEIVIKELSDDPYAMAMISFIMGQDFNNQKVHGEMLEKMLKMSSKDSEKGSSGFDDILKSIR